MSDQDVFKEEETAPVTSPLVDQPNDDDPVAKKLASLTREDGTPKYESVEKALDSLTASQEYIKKLEQEAQEREARLQNLDKQVKDAASYEDVLAKLEDSKENPIQETPVNGGLDEKDAEKLIEEVLLKRQVKESQQKNFDTVNKALIAKYGTEANKEVKKKAAELGMEVNDMLALAFKSPTAVLGFFDAQPVNQSMTTPSGTVDIPSPAPKGAPERTTGLLGGINATESNVKEAFRRIKEEVYAKHGVTE